MARFPYKPGAGAKGMKGPIYWNRLYLQETQSGRSRARYSEEAHLTARWLNVNTNLNFFLCGWFKPLLGIESKLTMKEGEALSDALDVVVEFRDTINSSWDYMSQANLNKYVTRIKRFFLLVFRLTIKYDVCPEGEPSLLDYAYASKEKDFILIYGDLSTVRRYFMGRPDVSQLAKIRRLYQESLNLVAEDFRSKSPAAKKKAVKRKKKKRRETVPSVQGRSKGVVEEITESGIIRIRYIDCVQREATVRRRIKLHLRVAFQPYATEGVFANIGDIIDTMVSGALKLDEGDSLQVPIKHQTKTLVVFEFER